jgi:hypothetical protein
LSGKKPFGYLDRLRESLNFLDGAIGEAEKARKAEKSKDGRLAVQWAKLLRDLVEQRNQTLLQIKGHLLGRDATGAIREPGEVYAGEAQVMFERDFQNFLQPWTRSDLNLKCEDCGVENQDVQSRLIEKEVEYSVPPLFPGELSTSSTTNQTEYHLLCSKCYQKRLKAPAENKS